MSNPPDIRRQIPSVDRVLQASGDLVELWGQDAVLCHIREQVDFLRENAATLGGNVVISVVSIHSAVSRCLAGADSLGLKPVVNLSGVVLHTNLGRASLPEPAAQAAYRAGIHPTNLEYDLATGKRGNRDHHVESLICELTGCEAATIVNNGAAAILLVLKALATGRGVPVSRGELVEIGGSFRMPEIMEAAGCKLVEVGATNRTHLADYVRAITNDTALLMKVHTSNYRIDGFTESVPAQAFIDLAREHDVPSVFDLGSGCLVDYTALGLAAEPIASDYISWGADIITFSGDKLLGGPQCGIIAGRKDLIEIIRRHPLKRVLRPDAMNYAALAEVLKLYRHPETLTETLPALRHMTRPASDIEAQVNRLCPQIADCLGPHFHVSKAACQSQIGSGSFPAESLESFAVSIRPASGKDSELRRLSTEFRKLPRPIISRLSDGSLLLDLRCLDDERQVVDQLKMLRDALQC